MFHVLEHDSCVFFPRIASQVSIFLTMPAFLQHVAEALHWEIARRSRERQTYLAAINHFQRVLQQLEATTAAGRDVMAEKHRALCEGQQIVEMLQTHQVSRYDSLTSLQWHCVY